MTARSLNTRPAWALLVKFSGTFEVVEAERCVLKKGRVSQPSMSQGWYEENLAKANGEHFVFWPVLICRRHQQIKEQIGTNTHKLGIAGVTILGGVRFSAPPCTTLPHATTTKGLFTREWPPTKRQTPRGHSHVKMWPDRRFLSGLVMSEGDIAGSLKNWHGSFFFKPQLHSLIAFWVTGQWLFVKLTFGIFLYFFFLF